MKSVGVIVEYNPFHNGHVYHLKEARARSGADVVVAVMSGNFLQRGEMAIVDKWTRAEMALQNGADLVVELPFAWSVQAADYFAKGGLTLLSALQVDSLCFGTDSAETLDYAAFGTFTREHQAEIDRHVLQQPKELSYPEKMTATFRALLPTLPLDFHSPNHILGLSYAKENAKLKKPLRLLPIERVAAAYLQEAAGPGHIASATAIRKRLFQGEPIADFVPTKGAAQLTATNLLSWERFWPYLRYRIVTSSQKELAMIYQMNEGLEQRFLTAVKTSATFQDFMTTLKTKRYTWTRLQRLALFVLVHATPAEVAIQQKHTVIRVLGFTEKGQHYLKTIKKDCPLELLTRFAKQSAASQELNLRVDQVYQLQSGTEQNFGRIPIRNSKV